MKIQKGLVGPAYETGYAIVAERGAALVPICPANGHFSPANITALLKIVSQHFGRIDVFIPDSLTEHTYRAIGYSSKKAERKARHQGNRLSHRVEDALTESNQDIPCQQLRWKDITSEPAYQRERSSLFHLFEENPTFRTRVIEETAKVVLPKRRNGRTREEAIEIGTPYVLEELAWVSASAEVLGVEKTAYVYHKPWLIEKFIAGEFDRPRPELGVVLTED